MTKDTSIRQITGFAVPMLIGISKLLQSRLIFFDGMRVQSLVNTYAKMTIAAYAAAMKIDSIAIQIIASIAAALSVFSGQNIGRGYIKRMCYMILAVCYYSKK